jgi:hypothetical protein
MTKTIEREPTLFRGGISTNPQWVPEVSKTGGNFNAGFIKNFAVITTGEALGHQAWVDDEFISQVATELAKKKKGVVSRYTHPSQSADGLSRGLGRVEFRSSGDGKVRGDLHFYKSAHKSPDGDLAGFLLELAQEDPESFGASIAFSRDIEAEQQFSEANPSSPDSRNVNNYPHVRLGELRFVDIVDQPAANPDGLFHKDKTFEAANQLISYAFGLSKEKPTEQVFGVDADRLAQFTSRFLSTQGLELMKIDFAEGQEPIEDALFAEEAPAEEAPTEEATIEDTFSEETVIEEFEGEEPQESSCESEEDCDCEEACDEEPSPEAINSENSHDPSKAPFSSPLNEDYKAGLQEYITTFGKEAGVDFYLGEVDFSEAQGQFIAAQKQEIERLRQELSVARQEEPSALSVGSEDDVVIKGKGLANKIRFA